MEILSVSMDKDEVRKLNEVQKRLGFKSRSKLLRSAITSLVNDYNGMDALSGHVESVFVLTYSEREKNHVSDIIHRFESTIRTELHQHHHSGMCVDIINLDTDAHTTKAFYNSTKRSKCIYSVAYALVQEKK